MNFNFTFRHVIILVGMMVSSSDGLSTIASKQSPRPVVVPEVDTAVAGIPAAGTVVTATENTNTNENNEINNFDITAAVDDFFQEVDSVRSAKVFEAPVTQDGIKLYIATDGNFNKERPGNGGIRLLDYESDRHAIDDAVRLAEGMTRKHDMFRTGFSGAKLVANTNIPLHTIERKSLMEDIATALEGMYIYKCNLCIPVYVYSMYMYVCTSTKGKRTMI